MIAYSIDPILRAMQQKYQIAYVICDFWLYYGVVARFVDFLLKQLLVKQLTGSKQSRVS